MSVVHCLLLINTLEEKRNKNSNSKMLMSEHFNMQTLAVILKLTVVYSFTPLNAIYWAKIILDLALTQGLFCLQLCESSQEVETIYCWLFLLLS